MTSPAAHTLLNDVTHVLDELEARFPRQPGLPTAERRTQLTMLVNEVCQRDGLAYPSEAVTEVIECLMTRSREGALAPVKPAPSSWAFQAGRATRRAIQRTKAWWKRQGLGVRRTVGTTALCLGVGLAITWFPWITVLKAPFLLALRHPAVYFTLFFAICTGLFIGAKRARSNYDLDFWCFVALMVVGLGGGVGGAVGYFGGTSTDDATRFQQNDAPAVQAALEKSLTTLPPGASFAQIMGEVQKNAQADPRVDTRHFSLTENDELQAMELHYSFNQAECEQVRAHPSRYFTVADVNDQPVNPDTFTCAFPWDNRVTVRSSVGWATHANDMPESLPMPLPGAAQASAHDRVITIPDVKGSLPPLPSLPDAQQIPPLPGPVTLSIPSGPGAARQAVPAHP